jgi:hypothetical protein
MKGRERERGKGRRKGESGRRKNRSKSLGIPRTRGKGNNFRNDFQKNLNGKIIFGEIIEIFLKYLS